MKPAPPSGSVMYGSRTSNIKSEFDASRVNNHNTTNQKNSHNKFTTNAEEQWYSMMASKSHADEAWAAQEKHIAQSLEEVPKQKVISSPHTATQFRVPGARGAPRGYAMVPHVVLGDGKGGKGGKGISTQPSSVMRVARPNPIGREVNSKTDAKPVPGQINPLGMVKRPGARPPPPMHPSMIMRKTNGMVTVGGARPPPPSMMKGLQPRGGGIHARGPPPEVLARLRARGPPIQARMRPSSQQQHQQHEHHHHDEHHHHHNTKASVSHRPSRLAQGGMDVLSSSKPLPTVAIVNGTATIVDETAVSAAVGEFPPIDSGHHEQGVDEGGEDNHEDEEIGHGWIQMWDEEVESNYYYNQNTGEASWIRPEVVAEDVGGDSVISSLDGGGGGSVRIDDVIWDKYWDEDAAAYYLHNTITGETKWENDQGVDYEADGKY